MIVYWLKVLCKCCLPKAGTMDDIECTFLTGNFTFMRHVEFGGAGTCIESLGSWGFDKNGSYELILGEKWGPVSHCTLRLDITATPLSAD
jgi:hypothetical protein